MIKTFLTVPVTDPDESRRRWLLNILLAGLLVLAVFAILATVWFSATVDELANDPGGFGALLAGLITFTGMLGIFWLNRNRRVPYWIPSVIFLVVLSGALAFSDIPAEVLDGRTLIVWILPVIIAPIILPPISAFAAALVISLLLLGMSLAYGISANIYAMVLLGATATVAWLAMDTLEKSAQTARATAAHNQAILDAIADAVIVEPFDGGPLSLNPAAEAMLSARERLRITQETESGLLEYEGRAFSVLHTTVPAIGRLFVVRDESRRREMEKAKNALLGTASHEMRTPLSPIVGFSEMILMVIDNPRISEEDRKTRIRQFAGSIREGGKRLMDLVDKMLSRAQIEAGELRLAEDLYNPRAVVTQVAQAHAPEAESKGLSFGINILFDGPQIGDAVRFGQVVTNLLSNAVKFTDRGSVSIGLANEGDHLVLTVSDTGKGIAPAALPDIFQPWRRASDYAVRDTQGAGLGLSIVKGIVDAMGGTIQAESTPGAGSTFIVRIPARPAENQTGENV